MRKPDPQGSLLPPPRPPQRPVEARAVPATIEPFDGWDDACCVPRGLDTIPHWLLIPGVDD